MTTPDEYPHTTADLALRFGISKTTVRKRASILGLGIDLEGRAGFRYSDDDLRKLIESLRPTVAETPRRRRRSA